MKFNYWKECINEAFEDAGIAATKEQTDIVISWVEGAYDNRSMAFGYDAIPNPIKIENDKLKLELEKERKKQICKECNGTGRIISQGYSHSSESECYKCRGEGKV